MTPRVTRPKAESGLSLVELLVAMTIGMIVIGVGASAFLNVATNTRNATELARMNENASIALNILRSHVTLAGYSRPTGVLHTTVNGTDVPTMTRAFKGGSTAAGDANNFIAGCDGGFVNPKAHELDISPLSSTAGCATARTGADAIAVVYEADPNNTYADGALPTDCIGHSILPVFGVADLFVASNKFYINTDTTNNITGLYCQGNGRDSPVRTANDDAIPSTVGAQMIVENIFDMQIKYGVADVTGAGSKPSKDAIAYLDAADINNLSGTDKWNRVVSVRICVEVRSTAAVSSSEQAKYLNCNGDVVANSTGKLVRTFSTTVVLHNRI
jgi:type IV pilus assembly protein PilW